ncbi:hypothetical protein KIN20_030436 [Parelaphostrongylus tenuis]|uniref:Uncharacterized protein n=1 Tax=Parelaphostrongylus tenuis TaxID=148309 RepID=A0AAD5R3Z9_PARTN|nr:hypothetical protein KIN20_030436 [Parelaphostrongylus tenuis]
MDHSNETNEEILAYVERCKVATVGHRSGHCRSRDLRLDFFFYVDDDIWSWTFK